MTDPLDALRLPVTPVDPDPAFATSLRARLERALRMTEGQPMTSTLSSYLAVHDARRALEFYAAAFDARPRGEPIVMDDGRIGHAELAIGDSVLMLADEFPEIDMLGPRARGGPTQSMYLRVPDVDATTRNAVGAGARLERPPADHEYGRNAVVVDPFGHRWMVAAVEP